MSKSLHYLAITKYVSGHKFCVYCGVELTLDAEQNNTISADHFVPKSKGGHNGKRNIVTACRPRNTKKADKLWPKRYNSQSGRPL